MTAPAPYWQDETTALYLGDCREVLPALGLEADLIVADPPYQETSLAWDRWPDGWPAVVASSTRQMWCFGSMRMFLDRRDEFDGWRLAQDLVWEKQQGTGMAVDRFRRVHEYVSHWYQGSWADAYKDPQREVGTHAAGEMWRRSAVGAKANGGHTGEAGAVTVRQDGTRLVRSVLRVRNLQGRALHPTEKPAGILRPLIAYSCPPGGLVVDPFAGSGSTLVVARELGMRAVGIESDPRYCQVIARRLAQGVLA